MIYNSRQSIDLLLYIKTNIANYNEYAYHCQNKKKHITIQCPKLTDYGYVQLNNTRTRNFISVFLTAELMYQNLRR